MKKLFLALIIFMAFSIFVLYTSTGLRLALFVTSKVIPGKLSVKNATGRLADKISLTGLSYKKGNITIKASDINLDWNPYYLLAGKLIIKNLNTQNVIICRGEPPCSPASKPIIINKLNAVLSTTGKSVNFADINLSGPNIAFKIKGQLLDKYAYNWILQIKQLNDFWPQINGILNAKGQIVGRKNAPELKSAFILKKLQNKIDVYGNLQARSDKKGLFTKVILHAAKQPPITAQFSFDKHNKIQGGILWRTAQLKLLAAFFPEIKNPQGNLNINLKLSGTLDKPQLQGNAILSDGSVYVPVANLKLHNINLTINGNLSALNYTGQIFSGDGYIKIDGKTDLNKKGFPTVINIAGKDFLLSNTDTIKIKVTPALQLLLDKKRLNISGNILIPWAKVEPHDFSKIETLPNDAVFVDKKGKESMPAIFSVYTKIKLILGDNINVNVMGLKGRLGGQLEIIRQPKVSPQAFGAITIYNGSYNIYGTELKLEKSKVTFNGRMDNPALNIRAEKTFKTVGAVEDLTVGAYITGTFVYPKTILYSRPSGLSQADILSYLMFGTSSSQLTQDKAGLLIKAAGALHFGGPSTLTMLTDNLRETFGLTEFGLATEAVGGKPEQMATNTVFVMGKYILPYLYVSYSVGLLDAVNIFRVRYKLGKKWAIQSESSSLGNGIDLLYGITRK